MPVNVFGFLRICHVCAMMPKGGVPRGGFSNVWIMKKATSYLEGILNFAVGIYTQKHISQLSIC